MANFYNYNPNQPMLNQLFRQKDNIENMIQQYSQPQQPIQNIINTGGNIDFEARILKEDEEIDNILINKRTMFLDKKNKKVIIKDLDGKVSEEYEIVLPLDEKDKKILELESRLKEMEEKINEYSECIISTNEQQKSNTNGDELIKSTTKTDSGAISKSTK